MFRSRTKNRFPATAVAVLFFSVVTPGSLFGQQPQPSPITLKDAIKVALEKNPQRKVAIADTRAASADVRQAKSVLYPHAMFSETATRGDDPVYVFGSKLRQQRFGTSDFALTALNTPSPLGNFSTRFGGTWDAFDSMASWHAVNRAEQAKSATDHQLERTEQEIVFRVTDSYYAALLATKEVDVAEQSTKTAQAILERSKNRVESGVVVESDSLSAQVRVASRKQELIRAQNNLAMARAELSIAMGLSSPNDFEPSDALAEKALPSTPLDELEKQAIESRPDLKRIRSEESAQQQSISIAKASFGPRVNAFASWEADNPTLTAGGGGNNWLAGIELQFDLFEGGAKKAELSRERAVQEKVVALKQIATDAVRLEVRKGYYDLNATRQQLEVARASIADAQESLRINQDRYDAGITTVTDLLSAEDVARSTQNDYWELLCRYYTSYAALELACGTLDAQSPVVTP
ncbi:MAG TPA: TolC family protein [Candidatus Acidoferrales bacterium]|nr:TolC family protein [Candidatus Acidoferrales bacterium]